MRETSPHQPMNAYILAILERHKQPSLEAWGNQLVETLRNIARNHPEERTCALNLAETLTRIGQFDAACPWYRQAVENRLKSDRPDLVNLGLTSVPGTPHFTIIGAMKGGTTSLYHYLSHHPQIFPTARKEIDFWSWRYQRQLDWYLAHFAPPAAVRGLYHWRCQSNLSSPSSSSFTDGPSLSQDENRRHLTKSS